MREEGAIPYTYTADIGQYDETDIGGIPARAKEYGAELARSIDCRGPLVGEGLAALACGAFHRTRAGDSDVDTAAQDGAVACTFLVTAALAEGVGRRGEG